MYFSIIHLLLWNPHLMFSLNFLGNYEPKRVSAASSSLCTHRNTDNTAVSTRPNSAKGPGERESLRAHNGASVLKGGVLSRSREVKNRSEEGAFLPWMALIFIPGLRIDANPRPWGSSNLRGNRTRPTQKGKLGFCWRGRWTQEHTHTAYMWGNRAGEEVLADDDWQVETLFRWSYPNTPRSLGALQLHLRHFHSWFSNRRLLLALWVGDRGTNTESKFDTIYSLGKNRQHFHNAKVWQSDAQYHLQSFKKKILSQMSPLPQSFPKLAKATNWKTLQGLMASRWVR